MLYERRRWRRRSTPEIRRSLPASASGSGSDYYQGDDSNSSSREGPAGEKSRLRRATSKSLREFWQVDGACCDIVLAGHLPQDDVVARQLSFFATRRHAVMDGIRQRIAGLRKRAETAPGRLEWSP